MCGIVGIFQRQNHQVNSDVLAKMMQTLHHRGPDGHKILTMDHIGFGFTRLAIIDLNQRAMQPMQSQDGRYTLIYNGEVYNFLELKSELEGLGYVFHTRTDAEVVLMACIQWGRQALQKFNGMFAFALWDNIEQKLFLARDRYGIKPLYYTHNANHFLFASEIKAICVHPEFTASVDLEALLEYFTFQNFFTDRTLFQNVKILPAGTYLEVELSNWSSFKPFLYWDYHFEEDTLLNNQDNCIEALDDLFAKAVKRQMVADVEVGSFLSGGMDSGSIVAVASHLRPGLKTFTCGFDVSSASEDEKAYDERKCARDLSEYFGTDHSDQKIGYIDMVSIISKLAYHIEEPRVGQSYPNYYAAQLARERVKVVLSGCGGDEIFAGYPWRYYRTVTSSDFEDYIDRYYLFWQRLVPNSILKKVFAPIWNQVQHVWTRDIFKSVFASHHEKLTRPEDYINHSLYFEAKTFLHGLLVVEDKLSMAHGLEVRVPFLDNDLVDFAMRIPVRFKLGNLNKVIRLNENDPGHKVNRYFQKNRDGKLILRQMMARHIPLEVTQRIKQGFSAPDASWFKNETAEALRNRLYHPNARIYNYFDRDMIQTLVEDHLSGRQNRRLLIWSLLNFEEWHRHYLG